MEFFIGNNKEDKIIEPAVKRRYLQYNNNGCVYVFDNLYTDDDNDFYLKKGNKFSKVKTQKIGHISFVKVKDINNNTISIII